MDDMTIKKQDKRLSIHLKIASSSEHKSPMGSHLLKAALVSLIEDADLAGWEKNEGELAPQEFYAALLAAVARRYNAELPTPMDDVAPHTILQDLIDHLQAEDYL
jgi:hypothetical protein